MAALRMLSLASSLHWKPSIPTSSSSSSWHKKISKFNKVKICAVLRIRTRMFFGFLDPAPDPLVGGTDLNPDPSIIKQKNLPKNSFKGSDQ
jgi:hypothetical protein